MNQLASGAASGRVAMLALSVDRQGWDVVRPYLAENGFSIPVALADGRIQHDYPAAGLPCTYVVNSRGIVVGMEVGGLGLSALEELAEQHAV